MKINEVIRKYRKQENLTQEQIAKFLNVSAPAVNKWENGNSYPDITLLAPLARILKIDVDTLLSFNEDLTDEEIKNFLEDIAKCVLVNGIKEGFEKAEQLIHKYPNCGNLIIRIAESMNMYNKLYKSENYDKYNKKVISWYELLVSSPDKKTSEIGKCDLVVKYIESEEYEKAQDILNTVLQDDVLDLNFQKKLLQAQIFEKTQRRNSSYEIYEEIILKCANKIMFAVSFIIKQLCDEEKYDIAEKYVNVLRNTNILYDLDKYSLIQSEMMISLYKKDKEKAIVDLDRAVNLLDKIISDNGDCSAETTSELYAFRKFKSNTFAPKKYRDLLKKTINMNSDYDFIRDDPRVKIIIKRLDI